jgi:hypothetical protein
MNFVQIIHGVAHWGNLDLFAAKAAPTIIPLAPVGAALAANKSSTGYKFMGE